MELQFQLDIRLTFFVTFMVFVKEASSIEKMPWISDVIMEGMQGYYPHSQDESSLCSRHGHLLKLFAFNYTLWALRMRDSTSNGPSGLIFGNNFDYGHYDECISTEAFNGSIKGKFMMISLTFWPKESDSPYILPQRNKSYKHNLLLESDSYWNVIEYTKRFKSQRIKGRNTVNWAICVPDSCSSGDVIYSVNSTLQAILHSYNIRGNVSILQRFTYSRGSTVWTAGAKSFMLTLLALFCLVVLGTFYDSYVVNANKKNTRLEKYLLDFSTSRNMKELEGKQSMSIISGLKVISMFIIIYGHRMFFSMFAPIHNTYDNEMAIGELLNTYYLNGILIVDSFLVISGFLSFNKMLKIIECKGQIKPFKCIFRRFQRFTPAYSFVLAYMIWIYPNLEGGPLARNVIWDASHCSQTWWTHLLYINNYVHADKQCIIPSYYLAVDMQLYVVSTLIGYLGLKCGRYLAISLLVLCFLLSISVPAIIILLKAYTGATFLYLTDFASYYRNKEFIETYLQTHFRATPYMVGMLAAWIYRRIQTSLTSVCSKAKFRFLMVLMAGLQLVSMNVSILSAWWFYGPAEEHWTTVDVMTFSALHRLGWAVPLASIIVLDSTNIFAPYRRFLGHRMFEPLNKLSYSVFLIHTLIQMYLAGQNRAPIYYNWLTSWWMAAADVVFSYGAAMILYLCIEAPFQNLFLKKHH